MTITGTVLFKGKTKSLIETIIPQQVFFSKDDITAGDGDKHDVISDKGAFSTTTTPNVFELLTRLYNNGNVVHTLLNVELFVCRCSKATLFI